jgi:hypothetical protein
MSKSKQSMGGKKEDDVYSTESEYLLTSEIHGRNALSGVA